MWKQAGLAEWCAQVGRRSATFLIDIRKAFELVSRPVLDSCAREAGFDVSLCSWLVFVYSMPRRLLFQSVATEPVRASRSIVAGDAFADLMMGVMMAPVVKSARAMCPTLLPALVMYDLQCQIHGPTERVVA